MIIMWVYKALNRTPNINRYWVGAVPNLNPKPGLSAFERTLVGLQLTMT